MSLYESFFKSSKDLCSIWTLGGQFKEINLAWETLLGWKAEDLSGKVFTEFVHPDDLERFQRDQEEYLAGRFPRPYIDCRFKNKKGEYRWLSWSMQKADSPHIFVIARDITDIRKNNVSLEALMASLDDIVFLLDESGVFIDLWTSNPGMLFMPKEKLIGSSIREAMGYHGVAFESVLNQSFRLSKPLSMEVQFPGSDRWYSAKVTPIPGTTLKKKMASFLVRDITDKIEAEQALDQERGRLLASSKMATLGEMAAGIAHEINNPLAIIQGKAWLLKKQIADKNFDVETFSSSLQAIHDTTDRISKIIHALRTFARNADTDPFVETSFSSIIDDTLELCREKFKNHGIQLRITGRKNVKLDCRGLQVAQVLLNLLSNSFDSVEKLQDPWVEVAVRDIGDKIEISVTDSGTGIPTAIKDKIMQPFFTTKEVGKGTGLGLSITKGIIESHKGEFFYDEASINTRFVIRLPKFQNKKPQQESA